MVIVVDFEGPEHGDRRALPQQQGQPGKVQRAARPGKRTTIYGLLLYQYVEGLKSSLVKVEAS